MLKHSTLLLSKAMLLLLAGCQRAYTPDISQGTYKLSSATLNQGGKFRELTCKGEFKFSLKKAEVGLITLEPDGEAECASENPASFKEILGGECDLGFVNFFNNGQGESYIHNGSSLTCFSASGSQVKFTMQPINGKIIRINRSSSNDIDVQSEILFERISDGV
ncbi:MAG: hypothetical protein FJY29_13275 [Betaproteobacteria bacterium]|nr:hypothetical protein [Betaproteobacteria bacterium]